MSYVVAVWKSHKLHRELRPENATGKKEVATKKDAADVVRRAKRAAVPGTVFGWPEIAIFSDGVVIEHWRLGRDLKHHLVEVEGFSGVETVRERVAKALGWSVEDTRSVSLQSLRDLVRPVSQKLAHEITLEINRGTYDIGFVERIPGGRASGMHPSDFDPRQLKLGIRVEMEHTRDKRIAQEIAMDHLTEDPRYYDKLRKAGL